MRLRPTGMSDCACTMDECSPNDIGIVLVLHVCECSSMRVFEPVRACMAKTLMRARPNTESEGRPRQYYI